MQLKGWEVGEMVQCSGRGPEFQASTSGSEQLPVIPTQENPVSSSGLLSHLSTREHKQRLEKLK